MPVFSQLYSIDNLGKIYSLSSTDKHWHEKPYCGLEFKRLSTCCRSMWAIGGDHQIYLYVNHSDVPIRVKEEAFENQRWNPYEGFTARLLPSDRPAWSNADGTKPGYKDRICLPNASWKWESPWYLENTIDGQPLGKEGWTYAVDFPRPYFKDKKWNSCVRRRKWIRYRQFMAMDNWTPIAGINEDPTAEPFIDISIGGTEIPGGDADTYTVWGVTILGRVFCRKEVTQNCPEGTCWVHVLTPEACHVNQISCGPTGLVWAINWEGEVIVRTGVNRHNIYGTGWLSVTCDSKLEIMSVGTNSVWAVDRNHKVWFRTGVNGYSSGECHDAACGTAWVEMVGVMAYLAVGMNDQVFAIGLQDREIYFRTGITFNEPNGRTWRKLIVPVHSISICNSDSELSLTSLNQSYNTDRQSDKIEDTRQSIVQINLESNTDETDFESSAEQTNTLSENLDTPNDNMSTLQVREKASNEMQDGRSRASTDSSNVSDTVVDFVNDISDVEKTPETDNEQFSFKDQPVPSDEIDVDNEDEPDENTWKNEVQDRIVYTYDQNSDLSWTWVCPRSCHVDPQNLPNWFCPGVAYDQSCVNEAWRMDIVSLLESRFDKEMRNYSGKYEDAIEKSKWVKTCKCKIFKEKRPRNWAAGSVALERQTGDRLDDLNDGKLICTFLADHYHIEISLTEITCILRTFLPSHCGLTIYTARRASKQEPLKLSFRSNLEMDDWLASLYMACYDLRKVTAAADRNSAFALSAHGEVYVHTPLVDMESASPGQMFWKLIGGHLSTIEACSSKVVWGIGYDNTPWVYTDGHGGGVFKGISGANSRINSMHDSMRIYIYENQRWNPLTGFSTRSLPTDRYQWSDQSGLFKCTKENTGLPTTHWTWCNDWCIDYKVPGGVDVDGWQYAYDFPRTYHGHKSFTDYVRRRRWYRKCKLATCGPWKEVGTTPLLAVSLQIDHDGGEHNPIALWAIATNGDALCRMGVTSACPEGVSWNHVPADQPFSVITVGGNYQVWAVACDGSAFLRHGITKNNFIGDVWFHIEPPTPGVPLVQISCGSKIVLAVDEAQKLWHRQQIIMPHFPEGTSWKFVCDNVQQVSIGPHDQIWGIADLTDSSGNVTGVMCRRNGVSNEHPAGVLWESGMAGGWQHLSVRACRLDLETEADCIDDIKPTFRPNASAEQANKKLLTSSPVC